MTAADDGLVLIEGELRTPEWVTQWAQRKMSGGNTAERRYFRCYPRREHDRTTPTLEQFVQLCGRPVPPEWRLRQIQAGAR